jgi:hypothetical protein
VPTPVDDVGPHVDALVEFMRLYSAKGPDLDKPTDEWRAVRDKLKFFTSAAAADFVSSANDTFVSAVFGFARALARGYAFVARPDGRRNTARFIGYQSNLTVDPGTIQLDATADIDGITPLCPDQRRPCPVQKADYSNLHIVNIPSMLTKKQRLPTFLAKGRPNKHAYAEWMADVIKANMEPGQRGLVVCKKSLIDDQVIPNWPDRDKRFENKESYTIRYGWELEGRHLSVTNWGAGIESNAWKDADVVFLFDEFFVPKRSIIATAQGLLGLNAMQGPLKELKGYNSRYPVVDQLWEGHLLRWQRQMCLRGKGRDFDARGVCGKQKLVTSADPKRLLANLDKLFPGAKVECLDRGKRSGTQAQALLALLGRPGLPSTLSTKWISEQLGTPWRQITQHLSDDIWRAIENLGWRYVSRKGRAGSIFERKIVQPALPVAVPLTVPRNRTAEDLVRSAAIKATILPKAIPTPALEPAPSIWDF